MAVVGRKEAMAIEPGGGVKVVIVWRRCGRGKGRGSVTDTMARSALGCRSGYSYGGDRCDLFRMVRAMVTFGNWSTLTDQRYRACWIHQLFRKHEVHCSILFVYYSKGY